MFSEAKFKEDVERLNIWIFKDSNFGICKCLRFKLSSVGVYLHVQRVQNVILENLVHEYSIAE